MGLLRRFHFLPFDDEDPRAARSLPLRVSAADVAALADALSARRLRPWVVALGDAFTLRAVCVQNPPGPATFSDATTKLRPTDATPARRFTDAAAGLRFAPTSPETAFSDRTEERQHTPVTGAG